MNGIRALAAQAVVVGHAISFYQQFPLLTEPAAPAIQDVGVAAFFFLSGFLIAYTIRQGLGAADYRFRHFALDRFARIYSAYLPCLVLIAILDYYVSLQTTNYAYAAAMGPSTFVANVLMLQDVPTQARAAWTSYGSARPLWTLALEWWIYMFVGAATLWRQRVWWKVPVIVVFGLIPAVNLIHGRGEGLFGLWLLGAAAMWILGHKLIARTSTWTLLATAVLIAIAYAIEVLATGVYQPRAHLLLALMLSSLIAIALRTRATVAALTLQRVVLFFSGYSLTLYLLHYTLIEVMRNIFPGTADTRWWQTILLANGVAILVAAFTERRYKALAKALRQRFVAPAERVAA